MYGYESVTIDTGVASGGSTAATSNSTSTHVVTGEICSIGLTYGDSPPAGTDVTIATTGDHGPALTILTLTNANTDGWFHPYHKADDETGADITYDGTRVFYTRVCVSDTIKVTIAQANNDDSVEAVIIYSAGR